MPSSEIASFGTRRFGAGGEAKERPYLVQGEAEFPRTPHESEPVYVLFSVVAIAPASRRRWDQVDALIVADRLDVAAGSAREFANQDRALGHAWLPNRLESVPAPDGTVLNADLKEHTMSSTIDKRSMARRSGNGSGAVLFTLGGLAAGFGVASCCALPLLLTTIGVGTAWLGDVALLAAPHRGALLAVGALCLLGGAALLWRQQQTAAACGPHGACTPPALRALTLVGLIIGAVLLWLGYAYA
jgi:mercuric ion transport protein